MRIMLTKPILNHWGVVCNLHSSIGIDYYLTRDRRFIRHYSFHAGAFIEKVIFKKCKYT